MTRNMLNENIDRNIAVNRQSPRKNYQHVNIYQKYTELVELDGINILIDHINHWLNALPPIRSLSFLD